MFLPYKTCPLVASRYTPVGFVVPWLGRVAAKTTFTMRLDPRDVALLTKGTGCLEKAEQVGAAGEQKAVARTATHTAAMPEGEEGTDRIILDQVRFKVEIVAAVLICTLHRKEGGQG